MIQARLAGGKVPEWLEKHIIYFDPQAFDLEKTTKRLRKLPIEQRRYVAELVREIRRLATCLPELRRLLRAPAARAC